MVFCPYCKKPAALKMGSEVYPHLPKLRFERLWVCDPCDARVGCHKDTDKPKGSMANAELRQLRIQAHKLFDPKWKGTSMHRSKAYSWLAKKMGIRKSKCHIGMFNKEQCLQVIAICGKGR